ncbi:hypothetical protein RJ639_007783 [Escallonia herrerae]|uniref:Thioredoxin domain-containing protein n=1 Tax=Escallonia herrerae TaxID=1293975 RepID=A0AA88VUK0_9ASTE|nr:hypothetical protein RJ639_007783 [Escallonia herrerae]
MKELSRRVTEKQEKFVTLKLMVVYSNNDRMLADALGAAGRLTIFYYHHFLSYKYQGRLRVQNILSSVHYLMSLLPEEIPFKSVNSSEDLRMFLNSTDKALLLLDHCGWTSRLLTQSKKNGSENVFEGLLGTGFGGGSNESAAAGGKKFQKRIGYENMRCGLGNEFSGIPWLGEFTPLNESDFQEAESMRPNNGGSCSFEEFQQFESFLSRFTTTVRDFFLPPERLRFGLISKGSLLSSLGVEDSGSWLMMLYFAGCPSCSRFLKEEDDLKSVLQKHASTVTELKLQPGLNKLAIFACFPFVLELECDVHDIEPRLPANKPSIILFIDRSSDSSVTRRNSKEALDAFRELALHHSAENTAKPQKSLADGYPASRSKSGHPKLVLSPIAEKLTTLKDKISIMVTSEGKHFILDEVAPNFQSNSLPEILAYILKHKKGIKLSSLAKDAGFQLLSDDLDINTAEALPAQAQIQESSMEDQFKDIVNEEQASYESRTFHGETVELFETTDAEPFPPKDQKGYADTPGSLFRYEVEADAAEGKVEEKTFSEVEKAEELLHVTGFKGSFFFSDGQSRLLNSLTPAQKIPSVVIIDPLSQQHYPLPEGAAISYSTLSVFLSSFVNGSLVPYQRSESVTLSPRESPNPPFVNLDFHDVDSVPRVTTHSFSELVFGNQEEDVLVLFSNHWCGFCQRMELVVREVYRAFKCYAEILKNENLLSDGDLGVATLKLPLIYLMDCTMNDCSFTLKSLTEVGFSERDLYPSVLLFPAERKDAVSYQGDMAVLDIIKFIADHGSNFRWLSREEVTGSGGVLGNRKLYEDFSQILMPEEIPPAEDKHLEVLLRDTAHKIKLRNIQIRPRTPDGSHETALQVGPGSILVSTDKLLNVQPFENSQILIVNVNRTTGFQGLIINKHISWDSLQELEDELELLREAPLSFGGPVVIRGMPLVALTQKVVSDQYAEVVPHIYFLDQWATSNVIGGLKSGSQSLTGFWFFLGYSSWSWDQLLDEIVDGAWTISKGNVESLDWPRS